MAFLATLFGLIIAIVVIAVIVVFLNRFYRKSSRDVALIRTGYGGQGIFLTGGCLALPFLHKVDEVNMRTIRVDVKRTGDRSSITEDRMRIDMEMEFYVRVQPTIDGVETAAQALGSKTLNADGIRNLLEGRFVDAIQSVAATQTMDTLHEHRAEFVQKVSGLLKDNLAENGLLLDSVSLTRMDQTSFGALDENNAFNAVGMRRLAEIIAVNKKKRAEIEADADVSVRNTELAATKQRLELTREQEQAQITQSLEIEKFKSSSSAEEARSRELAMIASENARIEREQETKSAEVAKQRALREVEIEAQLDSEVRKVDSAIKLASKQAEEAQALAKAELARTEIVLAKEKVQTDRERAVADRSREMAMKRVEEAGEVAEANAATETNVLLQRAKAESESVRTLAEAERQKMLAESEGHRAKIEAENGRSDALMALKLEQHRLNSLPAILEQMMKPAEKIDSIKINQVNGFGASSGNGAGGSGSAGGASSNGAPPVNQVMDSILGMALQLPALKNIGDSIGYDFSSAIDSIQPLDKRAARLGQNPDVSGGKASSESAKPPTGSSDNSGDA
ncbi:MAG: flotillin family protein [Burkholderiaceae bacterium]